MSHRNHGRRIYPQHLVFVVISAFTAVTAANEPITLVVGPKDRAQYYSEKSISGPDEFSAAVGHLRVTRLIIVDDGEEARSKTTEVISKCPDAEEVSIAAPRIDLKVWHAVCALPKLKKLSGRLNHLSPSELA